MCPVDNDSGNGVVPTPVGTDDVQVIHTGRLWRAGGATALVVLVAVLPAASSLSDRARAASVGCEGHAAASAGRAAPVTRSDTDEQVLVIGDSWSVGLGLVRPADSWPSQLRGEVRVAGFSGSGFSRGASRCDRVWFAARAPAAMRAGADLVVVEGGLNDFDQSNPAITAGFEELMESLSGHRVVVVGPPSAPARAGAVPRVDRLLASLSRRYSVDYVSTTDWSLPYLDDGLHPTPAGHELFGNRVAEEIASRLEP